MWLSQILGDGTRNRATVWPVPVLHTSPVFWMKLGVPITTACPFLPYPPLGGFLHHGCLLQVP